ncbi:hypothetical protein LUZ60_013794 [Juncus effusus]|nr:hypothetical protein LUZ60_013794 [Juncus effusus]
MHMEGNIVGMSVSFFLGVGATILLILLNQQTASYDVLSSDKLVSNPENNDNVTHQEELFPDLAPLLKRAATEDKTVIITSVNWAWAQPDSLLDIFLESFQNGDNIDHFVKHLVIVAFDVRAFERCKLLHPYCFQLKVDRNFTAPLRIMSPGYLDLVWEKIRILQYIVKQGYNFVFTDVDVMWFRNPLKHFTVYADLTLSCDHFKGDPENVDNQPNTGLFYVKSNNKTAKMMQHWVVSENQDEEEDVEEEDDEEDDPFVEQIESRECSVRKENTVEWKSGKDE